MIKLLHADISDKAWRAYYSVYNAHGHNYPEAFYEEMMRLEFGALGVRCATQVEYAVTYKDVVVGKHITDTEIEDCVVLEYKVQPELRSRHEMQLLSYLKVSGKPVGLLLNFGSLKPQGQRRVLTPEGMRPLAPWNPEITDPDLLYPELTLALRNAAREVYHTLGPGFLLRIYVSALRVELRAQGIPCQRARKLMVTHRGQPIGEVTFHHFIVDEKLVLAPVSVPQISQSEANKVRTLMATHGLRLGMIVNYRNEKMEVKYVRGKG
ncbi:MAG: GxxExxY protein [Anaerolineae bacterium]|nr:GxxExxY protein [Anaerolineae bacterium]